MERDAGAALPGVYDFIDIWPQRSNRAVGAGGTVQLTTLPPIGSV